MMTCRKPPKKPENDEDEDTLYKFRPDDIFTYDYTDLRMVEIGYNFMFVVSKIFLIGCLCSYDGRNIGAVVMYPLSFSTLYLVLNGLKSSPRMYIFLVFIGILMQVQILCLMSEYINTFRKDQSIFDDISSIVSQIPIQDFLLVIGYTFLIQLSNVLMFYVRRKNIENSEKKLENDATIGVFFFSNFLVFLYSFVFSLITPQYRFASVIIYPQLFTQLYLIKMRFESERIGFSKYFGYGVAMQIHTLFLLFIYRLTWNFDTFHNSLFSNPSVIDGGTFTFLNIIFAFPAHVYNIVTLYIFREKTITKMFVEHKHRRTLSSISFNAILLYFTSFVFSFTPRYRFACFFLAPQLIAQSALIVIRGYISFKEFLGFLGFAVVLQFQGWLLIDQYVILLKTAEENGVSSIFHQVSVNFVFILVSFIVMFQIANFVIHSGFEKNENNGEESNKNLTIKVLYKLILLLMAFALIWSLSFTQFRYVSIVLVPQIFTQLYLIKKGLKAKLGDFINEFQYGLASQLAVFYIISGFALKNPDEKVVTTVFDSYPVFCREAVLITIAITLFVQISNGIVLYIHSKRNEDVMENKARFTTVKMFPLVSMLIGRKIDEEAVFNEP